VSPEAGPRAGAAGGRAIGPRILILSAPYGAGHTRAAQAVSRALADEGARVEIVDHFVRFLPPAFVRASLGLFWAVLRCAPRMWGLAYAFSGWIGPRSRAMAGMDRIGAARLLRYLERERPDAVVHLHPTPAGALAWLRARGATAVPHGIVFTDFAAHPQWIHPGLERYFVPTEAVRAGVVAQGIAPDRVIASGLPVDGAFASPPDRATLRAALGLPPDRPVVLVTGGMGGWLRGVAEACGTLAEVERPFAALVVSGDHRRLEARLRARHGADPRFRILGRVPDMARVMGAVDLVVSKAGALTCAEALALGRPLLLHRSLPGQEQANEVALAAAGAALRARGRRELRRHLDALLGEPALRAALAAAARALRRPEAGRTVAKEMLALLGRA
jgi:processive 1,2-diacylglycerol beta-glucosyltransferase